MVCVKISRQGLATGAAVHLPGHCQFLEITLTSCQDEFGTEKKRKGRGVYLLIPCREEQIWEAGIRTSDLWLNERFCAAPVILLVLG